MSKRPLSLIAILIGAISACGTMPPKADLDSYPQRQMTVTVNGVQGQGVVVVPHADQYQIDVKASDDLDYVQVDSCHREFIQEKAGDKFRFTYVPNEVEKGRYCPIEILALSKDKSRQFGAWIEAQSERNTLPASLQCNGVLIQSSGVSVCQAARDLLQSIEFDRAVKFQAEQTECRTFTSSDQKKWLYKMPPRRCTVGFSDKDDHYHRLTTLGFDSVILRKN